MKAESEKKPISKGKKIYNIISTVVVALVFVFLVIVVALMLGQRNNGKDAKIFGYYTFNVLTDSMEGTINPGDVIICKEVDPNTLEVGDIITFVAPSGQLKGNNITHRIVEVAKNDDGSVAYFKTKGDNPTITTADAWELKPSAVKAKYVRTSKFITGFRELLSKWYGYVILIVLPLIIVFALIIAGFVKDKVAMEQNKIAQDANDDANGGSTVSLDNLSDEEKAKLLEEYLDNDKNKK